MSYNVDFNVAAIIFLTIFLIYHKVQYTSPSQTNHEFRIMIFATDLAALLDVITAYTIAYSQTIALFWNYLLLILYYMVAPVTTLTLIWYVNTFINKNEEYHNLYLVNRCVFITYCLLCCSTPFTKLMFYFDETRQYTHGSCYILLYTLPLLYGLESVLLILINRNSLQIKYRISVVAFIVIAMSAIVIQMVFFPTVLINFFGGSVAVFILLFAMETPDYEKLQKTMVELEKAKIEADAANHAKSQFLANMSHEIRTPINGILGMDEIAIGETDDPNIIKYLYDIKDAGKSLLSLINDILDFSKIESGKMEIVPVEYKLEDIVYNVNNLISMKAKEKGLDLIIKNDPAIPRVLYGDEVRVQQIITNILNNGVKYTKTGSVSLFLKYTKLDDENIELSICAKDTGMGIKDEDLSKLFESFQRVDVKANRNIEGTGLGLALTKQLAELMDGGIEVKSTYGVGSEFIVRIKQRIVDGKPMGTFDPKNHTHKEAPVDENIYIPGTKILVVDDVLLNLKVFEGFLKKSGAEITSVTSGKDCLALQEKEKFDIIFLDHLMPEMDGIETLERIRDDDLSMNLKTPIIALTANAISGVREQYIQAGFTDYLSKPVSKIELFAMIKKYVAEQEESEEEQQEKKSYIDMVRDFIRNDKREILMMNFRDNNLEAYAKNAGLVYKLANDIGSTEFADLAKELADAAGEGNMETIALKHDAFIQKYIEVRTKLEFVAQVEYET